MKAIRLFAMLLLAAMLSAAAGDGTFQDPVSGVVYLYDLYEDYTAAVASGYRHESDVASQYYWYRNAIANEVTILDHIEVDGTTYTVTSLNNYAFSFVSSLHKITIPKTVTYIGAMVFAGCENLTDVYLYSNPKKLEWDSWCLSYTQNFKSGGGTVVHVVAAYLEAYKEMFGNLFNVTFVGDLTSDEPIEESIVTTLTSFEVTETFPYEKVGNMMSEEDKDLAWLTVIPDLSASVEMQTVGEESGMCISSPSGNVEFYMSNSGTFKVTGPIKKIVVRLTGQLQVLFAQITDQWDADLRQDAQMSWWQQDTGFRDISFFFDESKVYTDAVVHLQFMGGGPLTIRSITIVQASEDEPLPSGSCGDGLSYKMEWLPVTVPHQETYETIQGIKLTVSGTGRMEDYGFQFLDGTWYEILSPWNDYRYNLMEVDLQPGITYIGENAFERTWNCNWVALPSTLTEVGGYAFYNCMFISGELRLPEGLRRIGNEAFSSLNQVKDVYVPKSLVEILSGGLTGIFNLENFHVDPANPVYSDEGNCIVNRRTHVLEAACKNTVIPADVEVIGEYAFQSVNVEEVALPTILKEIKYYGFGYSKIKDIVLPDAVQRICDYAFSNCRSLLSATIGSGVVDIQQAPFYGCTNLLDVFCKADPNALEWAQASNYTESYSFMPDKMTQFHVRAEDLEIWQDKFSFLNVTFVGDLGGYVLPITEMTTLMAEAVKGRDLTDNTIDNAYYNLDESRGCGYLNGTLVIGQTTDMSLIGSGVPGSAEVRDNFNGIIFKVGPGKGTITVDAGIIGRKTRLAVRIGNGTPVYAGQDGRWNTFVAYNVTTPTYVYIYAVVEGELASGRRAPELGDDALVIYGISIEPETSGIESVVTIEADSPWYDLSGRRLEAEPAEHGIYIKNGRKVVIR